MQWPQNRPGGGGVEGPVAPGADYADALLPTVASNNGGHVLTLPIDVTSPAVDSGVSNATVPDTDARGQSRVGAVDRGSFELDPFDTIFVDGFED